MCFLFLTVPEGVPAPFVAESISDTVLISWDSPAAPNGIILNYYIERATVGGANFTRIGTVAGGATRVFVDTTTLPFTEYEYRIVAENSAGSAAGPSTTFTTPEAGI